MPMKAINPPGLPTPIAPTCNNMVPTDRAALIPVLTMLGEVATIGQALPNDRSRCSGRVPGGHYLGGLLRAVAVDFRMETIAELIVQGQ